MTINRYLRATVFSAILCLGAVVAHAQQLQTWLMLNPTSQETFFSTDPGEQATLLKSGWKVAGTGFLQVKAQTGSAGVKRLVKTTAKGADRIFATSPEQVAAAIKLGYLDEGTLGQVSATSQGSGLVPVYHFTKDSRNLWLLDKNEPWMEKSGWILKGVAFWLWPKT